MHQIFKLLILSMSLLALGACRHQQSTEPTATPEMVYSNTLQGGWGHLEREKPHSIRFDDDSVFINSNETHAAYRFNSSADSIIIFSPEGDTVYQWRYRIRHDTLWIYDSGIIDGHTIIFNLPRYSN